MRQVRPVVSFWGRSTPASGEIVKNLAGTVPTFCAVERSFSAQESYHYLIRKRLSEDMAAMLMFVHMNNKLLAGAVV